MSHAKSPKVCGYSMMIYIVNGTFNVQKGHQGVFFISQYSFNSMDQRV